MDEANARNTGRAVNPSPPRAADGEASKTLPPPWNSTPLNYPSQGPAAAETEVWDPLPVACVAELFLGLEVPWWIAGGHAIEMFLGRPIRSHGDTDVLIRRIDQLRVQEHLRDWDLHRATYPGLSPWLKGEYLDGRYRDIWCRRRPQDRWSLQIMLLDTEAGQWLFKRDPLIRGNLEEMGRRTPGNIPYLAPEIQLLYKAKVVTLEKDQVDFVAAAPLLAAAAREWLLTVLMKRFPQCHPWITALHELAGSSG